jgi:hypothetical protein
VAEKAAWCVEPRVIVITIQSASSRSAATDAARLAEPLHPLFVGHLAEHRPVRPTRLRSGPPAVAAELVSVPARPALRAGPHQAARSSGLRPRTTGSCWAHSTSHANTPASTGRHSPPSQQRYSSAHIRSHRLPKRVPSHQVVEVPQDGLQRTKPPTSTKISRMIRISTNRLMVPPF